MESFATPYPVFFHDGEREHDKGHIGVHSVLTFKRFQALLSQKVGFPVAQLSAVFVCRRSVKDTDNKRQKLPINENTNFNIILNQHNPKWEKDCHFLVSTKKSKKERRGSSRKRNAEAENGEEDSSFSPRGDVSPRGEESKEGVSANDGGTVESGSLQEAPVTNTHGSQPSCESTPESVVLVNQDLQPLPEGTVIRLLPEGSSQPVIQPLPEGSPQPVIRPLPQGSPQMANLVSQQSQPLQECSLQSVIPQSQPSPERSAQSLIRESWPFLESSLQSVHQRLSNSASPDVKCSSEKMLLRRDQANPASPIPGWKNGSHMNKQVDSVPTSAPIESILTCGSAPHQIDLQNGDKRWGESEPLDGRLMLLRNDQKWVAGQAFHHNAVASQSTEGFQERYIDAVLTRSPVLLQRNGILNLTAGTLVSPSLLPATRPLMYSPTANMLLPRVPSSISGLASGTDAALNLQQAQAHYLNLHAQQSDQMRLSLQALSKMRGVVQGLAAYENRNHKPLGVCQHCYRFRERKINPTPFHLCVHDRIMNGFRGPSPAGPIERPAKRVEAAA